MQPNVRHAKETLVPRGVSEHVLAVVEQRVILSSGSAPCLRVKEAA